jgi:hypothetical protein
MRSLKYVLSFLVILFIHAGLAQAQTADGTVKLPDHPRLLSLKGQEVIMMKNVQKDPSLKKIHQYILTECESMMGLPPVKNIKIGMRLLDKSRECLRRVFFLSYAYRTTRQQKYLERAEKELLAVSSFESWNPAHFLDVAEMTLAVAIGYDWLYADLPETSRIAIKEAILKKGIMPSLDEKYNSWLQVDNNWNQVCNAGITYGALATYEDHPDLSLKVINRAVKSIDLPMKAYEPDGAYPEGYMYWSYGTTFNVLFVNALETAFGKDFGLTQKPGFMRTASFMLNMTGATGKPFNFSDAMTDPEFNPAIFWFANKVHDPSLLWVTRQQLAGNISLNNRLLPLAMVWNNGMAVSGAKAPESYFWTGKSKTPVALMRTSWTDPDAIFVGIKGGTPSENHSHMDAGSFIMESAGVRWAMDLGMQDYESLESKGIDLWNMKQDSQRWKVLRYNNYAHNTLTLNNAFQHVTGSAAIISHSDRQDFMNAVIDLTSIYAGKAGKVTRGVAIVDRAYVIVRDELQAGTDTLTVRWSMVTPAEVKIIDAHTAELTKDGKKLLVKVQAPEGTAIKTWSTVPVTSFDAPNPGTQIVGFEVKLPPNSKKSLIVYLLPEKTGKQISPGKVPSLAQWPQ